MSRDALKELQAWNYGHKSRSVEINHDDGYGAGPGWEVTLRGCRQSVKVFEMGYAQTGHEFPMVDPEADDAQWLGLEAVILAALDKANERGL